MWIVGLLPPLMAVVGVVVVWWWKGRDEPPEVPETDFPPPFPPWAVGVIIDEHLDGIDWLALVLWLVDQGHLKLVEESEGIRVVPGTPPPPPQDPVGRAFYDWLNERGGIPLGKRVPSKELNSVARTMYETLTHEGYFAQNPQRVRQFWKDLGYILAFSGIFGWGVGWLWPMVPEWKAFSLGLVGAGWILWAMAPHMPRKTAKGSGVQTYVEKLQRRFAQGDIPPPPHMALLYALVLGMATTVMEHMGAPPPWWPKSKQPLDWITLAQSFQHIA